MAMRINEKSTCACRTRGDNSEKVHTATLKTGRVGLALWIRSKKKKVLVGTWSSNGEHGRPKTECERVGERFAESQWPRGHFHRVRGRETAGAERNGWVLANDEVRKSRRVLGNKAEILPIETI